jgi:hypothetical protein
MRLRRLLVGAAALVGGTAIAVAAAEKVISKPTTLRAQPGANIPLGLNYDYEKIGIPLYEKDPVTTAVRKFMERPTTDPGERERSRRALTETLYLKKSPKGLPPGVKIGEITCGGQCCSAIVAYDDVLALRGFDQGRLGDPSSPLATWSGGAGRTALVRKNGALVATWYTYSEQHRRGKQQ